MNTSCCFSTFLLSLSLSLYLSTHFILLSKRTTFCFSANRIKYILYHMLNYNSKFEKEALVNTCKNHVRYSESYQWYCKYILIITMYFHWMHFMNKNTCMQAISYLKINFTNRKLDKSC